MRTRWRIAIVAVGLAGALVMGGVVWRSSAETFVADAHWSSAVVASRSGRTLTVLADVRGMDDRFDCGPTVRTEVSETSTAIAVRVQLFDRPLPPNTACGGVGLITVPATIRLRSAIGDRRILDSSDDRAHAPLVVDETRSITSVPPPFTRRSTGWDEATGQVSEWWRWQRHGEAQQIDLDLGPTATAARWNLRAEDATRTVIDGVPATVWREPGGDTVTSSVVWSPQVGQTYRLTVSDQAKRPMTSTEVIALARSVR